MTTRYHDCNGDAGLWRYGNGENADALIVYPRCHSQHMAYDPLTRRFVWVQHRYNPRTYIRAAVVRYDLECDV